MKKLKPSHTTARNEIRRRAPWIALAVCAGIVMVFVGHNFEAAFSRQIELAFFVPVIVYMSDSIGTETLALFVRETDLRRMKLRRLVLRESTVGITLGLLTRRTRLDPFCGSGSSLVAARDLGRAYIGVELTERYHRIASDRLRLRSTA